MSPLARYFRAERIKWRRSWTLVAAVLAPLCQAANLFLVLWYNPFLVRRFRPGFEFWVELNFLAWNLVFLPILVALVCSVSWDQEKEARAWNHLLVQPVSRATHYAVKLLSHLSLVFLAQALLVALLIPGGILLRRNLGWIMGDLTAGTLLRFASYAFLAAVPLVAFHTWLSVRLPGLGVALLTALAGSWLGVQLAGRLVPALVLPWGMAAQIVTFFDRFNRHIPWTWLPGALAVAAVLAWLGARDFARDREPIR